MRRIHQMMPLLLHTEERRLRQDAQALMIEYPFLFHGGSMGDAGKLVINCSHEEYRDVDRALGRASRVEFTYDCLPYPGERRFRLTMRCLKAAGRVREEVAVVCIEASIQGHVYWSNATWKF